MHVLLYSHFMSVITVTLYTGFKYIRWIDVVQCGFSIMSVHYCQSIFILDNDPLEALTYSCQIFRITDPKMCSCRIFPFAVTTEAGITTDSGC